MAVSNVRVAIMSRIFVWLSVPAASTAFSKNWQEE
jgi:hypothetical protein